MCEPHGENPQIVTADKPPEVAPIEKGMAGPGLLAYVITSKFADFLPLYRLENIFARNGFEIDRATLCVWAGDVADLIRPLYDRMVQRVLQSHVIHTDDTVMPLIAPEKTKQARMWVYAGDAPGSAYNVFDFTLSRARDGPARFLHHFQGTLVADAYGGYDGICVEKSITQAGCWSHARRKFVDCQSLDRAITAEALALIGKLFAVEEQAKAQGLTHAGASGPAAPAQRARARHAAQPAAELARQAAAQASGGSGDRLRPQPVGAAHRVHRRRGRRPAQQHRRAGDEASGAQSQELIVRRQPTRRPHRRHAIDPQLYLTQLLANLPGTPLSELDAWLPDQWKQRQSSPPV